MVKMYTTGCPRCNVLKKKLDEKGIQYEMITDKDIMISKGFSVIPILEVDDRIMEFAEAVKWINGRCD